MMVEGKAGALGAIEGRNKICRRRFPAQTRGCTEEAMVAVI